MKSSQLILGGNLQLSRVTTPKNHLQPAQSSTKASQIVINHKQQIPASTQRISSYDKAITSAVPWSRMLNWDPMNCVLEASNGLGAIYIGNIQAAQDVRLLKEHNIDAVLTVGTRLNVQYSGNQIKMHEVIHALDAEQFCLAAHFDKIIDFIARARQVTNVLVHCYAGISRSTTSVLAYMMQKLGYSFTDSYNYVKTRRWQVNPNLGFQKQLQEFEKRLNNNKKIEKNLSVSRIDLRKAQSFNQIPQTHNNLIYQLSSPASPKEVWPKTEKKKSRSQIPSVLSPTLNFPDRRTSQRISSNCYLSSAGKGYHSPQYITYQPQLHVQLPQTNLGMSRIVKLC